MKKLFYTIVVALFGASFSLAHADEMTMQKTLAAKYPNTVFKSIEKTQIPGIYQVVMGRNVAYVAEDGRYFLFGSLYDMQTQTDLSVSKREAASKIDVSSIPLDNAIKTVKGKGTRKLIVYTDPDCPYCKVLAKTLDEMDDVTVYNILFPIDGLHPDATRKAENIYCSENKSQVLENWLVRGIAIKDAKQCKTPVADNIASANKLGLNGTPMIIGFDGRVLRGAASKDKIEEFLAVH
jgi:thiol:disulfide interchange protein DsbC